MPGFCWNTCDGTGWGKEWCWLGSNYQEWINAIGNSFLPREKPTNKYIACRVSSVVQKYRSTGEVLPKGELLALILGHDESL